MLFYKRHSDPLPLYSPHPPLTPSFHPSPILTCSPSPFWYPHLYCDLRSSPLPLVFFCTP